MEVHEITGLFLGIQILLFIGMMLSGLAVFGFWIWMLVDCLKHENDKGNDKLIWVLVIVLTNWIGALIYFFVRRPDRKREVALATPPALSKS